MNKPLHPVAIFRVMLLGPLISREELSRGELKTLIDGIASHTYTIPKSKRIDVSPKAIERWYYAYLRGGIDALAPKTRCDKNKISAISEPVKEQLLVHKQSNLSRSINGLIHLLEKQGLVGKGELARATVHRFLKIHDLSKRTVADANTIERRSFEAEHAGDIWYGDVMHGPRIQTPDGQRKVYLVSLMDDASRLIAHSAFCHAETALDIEGVLKQALLKRGLPKKLIVDNGAAYRSLSLQGICARLGIRLIYSRPYEPQSKAKLERYHRTFREQFLTELNLKSIHNLDDLNARLWAWIEEYYHKNPHSGLGSQMTPINRWRQDLLHIRPLGNLASLIDEIFYHRIKRFVRKDGTVTWDGNYFEVPYETVGDTVYLVVNPHDQTAYRIESKDGKVLGAVTKQNQLANLNRKRQRPNTEAATIENNTTNMVDLMQQQHRERFQLTSSTEKKES
jgi:transposase InsO family protein